MRFSSGKINNLLGLPKKPAPGEFYSIEDGETTRFYFTNSEGEVFLLNEAYDGDHGDIIVSGGGTVWELDPSILSAIGAGSMGPPGLDGENGESGLNVPTALRGEVARFLNAPTSVNLYNAISTSKTGTGALVFATAPSLHSAVTVIDSTSADNTSVDGLILYNDQGSTPTHSKWSPRLRFTGSGFDGTSDSADIDFILEAQTLPGQEFLKYGKLVISSQYDGGGYTEHFSIDRAGTAIFAGNISAANLSGTNTGDQTSIVGIGGTKAQFNTALSDGDFLFVGDVIAGPPGLDGETIEPLMVPGPMGPQGSVGLTGNTGAQGIQGVSGMPGLDGNDGEGWMIPGPVGPQGVAGSAGSAGAAGPVGPMGVPGLDGEPSDPALFLPPVSLRGEVTRFLDQPTSTNLRTAVTDETGTGSLVFNTSPIFSNTLEIDRAMTFNTPADGLILQDTTGGGMFLDYYSPRIRWATAANYGFGSIPVTFTAEALALFSGQNYLVFGASTSGDPHTTIMTISDFGDVLASGNITGDNLSGTNTGDQTSIVGITGTKAQFNTALTNGDFLFVGDVAAGSVGPPGLDGDTTEPMMIPGIPGPQGLTGAIGPVGPAGIAAIDGETLEPPMIPGPQGPQGIAGTPGVLGPPGLDGETPDYGLVGMPLPAFWPSNLTTAGWTQWTNDTAFPGAVTNSGYQYHSAVSGLVMYGAGSSYDFVLAGKNGTNIIRNPTGSSFLEVVGSVGIGTPSPGSKIHVFDSTKTATTVTTNIIASIRSNASGADCTLQFSDNTTYAGYISMLGGDFHISPYGLSSAVIVKASGNVGIGLTPSARLHLVSTTEQLRVEYDVSNYYSTTVSSAGRVAFNAIGSDSGFNFADHIYMGYQRQINWGGSYGVAALYLYDTGASNRWGWGLNAEEMQFFGTSTGGQHISFNGGGDLQTSGTNEVGRIYFDTGNVGFGTGATVSARLHLIKTTEQLRVGYDASNYWKTTVASDGATTFDAVGSGAGFTFSDSVVARVSPRVFSTASTSTLTPEISTYDAFSITALAANLTIANHSTSTPTNFETMKIRILDNGTSRTLTFGTAYVGTTGTPLPTATTISTMMELLFEYNSVTSKWMLMSQV